MHDEEEEKKVADVTVNVYFDINLNGIHFVFLVFFLIFFLLAVAFTMVNMSLTEL